MNPTHMHLSRASAVNTGAVVIGGAVGLLSSSFGLVVPWVLSLAVVAVGLLHKRSSVLVWVAMGIAAGAVAYYLLALVLTLFATPSHGAGGT